MKKFGFSGMEPQINLAEELVSMGIPKQDIVIGFHSPHKRQFTDFAMG